jgi:hypothetical protein
MTMRIRMWRVGGWWLSGIVPIIRELGDVYISHVKGVYSKVPVGRRNKNMMASIYGEAMRIIWRLSRIY